MNHLECDVLIDPTRRFTLAGWNVAFATASGRPPPLSNR